MKVEGPEFVVWNDSGIRPRALKLALRARYTELMDRSDSPARAEPIDCLRDDVRLLGELVGQVLREQSRAGLLETVERLRTAAIALRSGEAHPAGVQTTE